MPIRSLILTAALALAACGPSKTPTGEAAPDFEGGGQPENVGESVYPGPYGIGVGSVIYNYQFQGYPRASLDITQQQTVQMSDFYNPNGDAVYPAGSPYGEGTPKPKAIVVVRSAVWCGPCNTEAAVDIPQRRAMTAPDGDFLVVLDETSTPGQIATPKDLENWAKKYKLDYPGGIDPAQRLDAIVGVAAYPGNVIVRTKDMKIIAWTAGGPDAAFWKKFQDTIDGKAVLPGE